MIFEIIDFAHIVRLHPAPLIMQEKLSRFGHFFFYVGLNLLLLQLLFDLPHPAILFLASLFARSRLFSSKGL